MSVCSLIVISIVKPMATYNKKYVFCLFCLIADEENTIFALMHPPLEEMGVPQPCLHVCPV